MKNKFKLFKFVSLLFLVVFCVVLFNFKKVSAKEIPNTTWKQFDIGGGEYDGIYSYGYLDLTDFNTNQDYNLLFRINEDLSYFYNDYYIFLFIEYKGSVSSLFSYNRCYVNNEFSIITNQTNYSYINSAYDYTDGYTWNNGGFVAEEGRGIEKRFFVFDDVYDPNESLFDFGNGDTLIIHFDQQEITQNQYFSYEEIGVYVVICNDYSLNWTDFQVVCNQYVIGQQAVAYDSGYQAGIVAGETVYSVGYNEGYSDGYNYGILEGQNNSNNQRYWLGYRNAIFNIWELGFDRTKNITLDQIIEYANGYEPLSPSHDIEGKDINFYTSKDYFTYNDWVLTQVYEQGISTVPKSDNTYYDNTESIDYRSGYGQAWGLGYDLGYSEGSGRDLTPEEESIVYNWGYNAGYKAGQEDHNVGGLLKQAFGGVGELLDYELLPNLTLGGIVIVPLLLGIVFFILKRG